MANAAPLLAVEGLSTRFFTTRGEIGAVDKVSLRVEQGESVGIVGESGSGKSVTALSILRLVPMPGRIVAGSVLLRGRDLLTLSEAELRQVRRRDIAMVFQDASSFLNPVMRIGNQIGDGIAEPGLPAPEVSARVIAALRAAHIPDPERVAAGYPMQLSGGMQQRVVIAAALARRPVMIIADEPTTALDATVQYQILQLLSELQAETGTSLLLISHDLAVIAGICSRVYVMYAGQIVESGSTAQIYRSPAHPYTQALLGAILDPFEQRDELIVLKGSIPDAAAPPQGCRFHPRCPHATDICVQSEPPEVAVGDGHTARCWLHVQ